MDNLKSFQNEQLVTLKSIADGVTALFFPSVEAVIHAIDSNEVVYISNNLSKRNIGDASGLEELNLNDMDQVFGPYEKLNWDGKKIRSVSIKASQNASSGYLLCINFSTALLEDAHNALELFLSLNRLQPQPKPLFEHDWQEKINTCLHMWLTENNVSLTTLTREQKKEIIKDLQIQGIFNFRNSADYIANVLSMGRATVYKHLKEIKNIRA